MKNAKLIKKAYFKIIDILINIFPNIKNAMLFFFKGLF